MIFLNMSSPEGYMLPCLNKTLFGIDCLGCGIQRSVLLLFQGEFLSAYKMYPAIYTLIVLVFFLIFNSFKRFKNDHLVKIALIIVNVIIVVVSYIFKITH